MAKRYYKDTPQNRKLGRVGKEIPSRAKKEPAKKTTNTPQYQRLLDRTKARKEKKKIAKKAPKYDKKKTITDSDGEEYGFGVKEKPKKVSKPKKKAESKKTVAPPPKKVSKPKPPSYDEITKDEKKTPAKKKGETDKEYKDRYFIQ